MKCTRKNVFAIIASLAILCCGGFLIYVRLGNCSASEFVKKPAQSSASVPIEDSIFVSRKSADIPGREQRHVTTHVNLSDRAMFKRLLIDNNMRIRRSNLDRTYAPLIAQLKLTPDEIAMLKDLLAEYKTANETAVLQDGSFKHDLSAREEVKSLEAKNQQEIMGSIAKLLGTERYDAFLYYESTLPQREEVETIGRKFSYQADPLTSEQKDLLIDIFYDQALLRDNEQNPGRQAAILPKRRAKSKSAQASGGDYKANILLQAAPFLTESQIKALEKHLDHKP